MPIVENNVKIMDSSTKRAEHLAAFNRLLDIMEDLRAKCPWDRKQTFESLRTNTIEEVHELSEAILASDLSQVEEEAGDLLLHLVFYAKLGSEVGAFDIGTMATKLAEKLIRRHPHIYGDTAADDEAAVKANWEQIKQKEQKNKKSQGALSGVPSGLPTLIKAFRMQEKAAGLGFDWDNPGEVLAKVKEELGELQEAIENGQQTEVEAEFGDVLFSIVNYGRHLKVNPDDALEKSNLKFKRRFEKVEAKVRENKQEMHQLPIAVLEEYWQNAKKEE